MSGGAGQLVTNGPLILAVPVVAAAGAITFASPCCLPLIPGYLSYLTGMSDTGVASAAQDAQEPVGGASMAAGPTQPHGRTVAGAALFVAGFSALFASYGAAFGGLGATLLVHQRGLIQVLGGLTIGLGLLFAGAFDRFPAAGTGASPVVPPPGGAGRGSAAGGAVRAGLDAVHRAGPGRGAHAGGDQRVRGSRGVPRVRLRARHRHPVPGRGAGVPAGMRAFSFARRHAALVTRAGGAMLVIVGVLQVTGAWTAAMTWLRIHWISGYELPL